MKRTRGLQLLTFFALGFVCLLVKRTCFVSPDEERATLQALQLANEHPALATRRALLAQAALEEGLGRSDPVVQERLRALFPEQNGKMSMARLFEQAHTDNLFQRDPMLRMRLSVLAELSLAGPARSEAPDERALRRFYEAHLARYMRPARVSFRQVFVSRDERGERAEADARAMRNALLSGDGERERSLGDPINLPSVVREESLRNVRSRFGEGVADALFALPIGTWSEPVASAWGLHLLLVTARLPEQPHDFAAVRTRVAADQRASRERAQLEAQVAQLSRRYAVELIP